MGRCRYDRDPPVRPLARSATGYAIGRQDKATVNNAVLRMPKTAPALDYLLDLIADPEFIPPWMRPVHRNKLRDTPPGERLIRAHQFKRATLGPIALTYALQQAGGDDQAADRDVYYPVPWPFTDVLFSPHGGTEGWIAEQTCGIHLWNNLLRPHHKTHKPHPDSYVGRMVSRLGTDISALRN
jgi:hypothetical protein